MRSLVRGESRVTAVKQGGRKKPNTKCVGWEGASRWKERPLFHFFLRNKIFLIAMPLNIKVYLCFFTF